MAAGGRRPFVLGTWLRRRNADCSALPIAVPPLARRSARSDRTAERSVVGDCTNLGEVLKAYRPTLDWLGARSRKRCAALRTAASREGATSVAAIEPLVSINSMTVLFLTRAATLASGGAAAMTSATRASAKAMSGAWRRQPGRLGITDAASQGE